MRKKQKPQQDEQITKREDLPKQERLSFVEARERPIPFSFRQFYFNPAK